MDCRNCGADLTASGVSGPCCSTGPESCEEADRDDEPICGLATSGSKEMAVKFNPGDRVRDVNHEWTPTYAEFGTVAEVFNNGNVDVDWDGQGVGMYPSRPETLARIEK